MELYAAKTWFDKHHGVVALEDDVLGIVGRIREYSDGRIHVYYNEQTGHFDLVESCLDHTERLVFSVDALDERCIERLYNADQWGADTPDRGMAKPEGSDFLAELDEANEEWEREKMAPHKEALADASERLAHALGEDGRGVHAQISVAKDIRGPANPPRVP